MAAKPWLSHKPWGFPFPYICQAPSHLLFILFLLLLSAYSFTLYSGIYLGIDQGRATTFFCTGWAQVWRPKVPLNIQSIVYRLLMAMQRALIIFSNRKNPSLHSSPWSFLTVTPWIHLGTMSFPCLLNLSPLTSKKRVFVREGCLPNLCWEMNPGFMQST